MRRLEEGPWTDGQTERDRCTGLGVAGSLVPAPSPQPIQHQPRSNPPPPPPHQPACLLAPPTLPPAGAPSPDRAAAGAGLHRPEGALPVSAMPLPLLRPSTCPSHIPILGGGGPRTDHLSSLGSHRPHHLWLPLPPRRPLCTSEVHLPLPGASPLLPSLSRSTPTHSLTPHTLAICWPGTSCARVGVEGPRGVAHRASPCPISPQWAHPGAGGGWAVRARLWLGVGGESRTQREQEPTRARGALAAALGSAFLRRGGSVVGRCRQSRCFALGGVGEGVPPLPAGNGAPTPPWLGTCAPEPSCPLPSGSTGPGSPPGCCLPPPHPQGPGGPPLLLAGPLPWPALQPGALSRGKSQELALPKV